MRAKRGKDTNDDEEESAANAASEQSAGGMGTDALTDREREMKQAVRTSMRGVDQSC
jgi:hypothetical protein